MQLRTLAVYLFAVSAFAQTAPEIQKLAERLDRLEEQNKQLLDEVHSLRGELAALKAPSNQTSQLQQEQIDVEKARVEELAQSKVETSQKMPVSLTGMLLFNAFMNGKSGGTLQDPLTASLNPGTRNTGASIRQTVIGLKFDGPELIGGGKASGNVYMDFFGGSADPANNLFRLRVATLDLAWKNTTITVGQDKPIFAPREPTSLAQVGISPLTSAGNLWDWRPQARVEQRFRFSENAGIRAQGGLYLTDEGDISIPAALASSIEKYRPAYEGRVEFYRSQGKRKFEIAPGFHFSTTHVAGASVPSRIVSLDWLVQPEGHIAITGAWFNGENTANTGSLRQAFVVIAPGVANAVHSYGGWAQIALFPTSRITVDIYGGQQHDRGSDLGTNFFSNGGITRNFTYATNFIYRLAPNILAAFELSQNRTTYRSVGNRLNNHYDLSLAYLF